MLIETSSYRVSRTELTNLATAEYLRQFWWFVAVTPVFGLLALIFGSGPMQAIGMFAILWPFSIPARSVLSTAKTSRLVSGGCRVRINDDLLEFLGEKPGPSGKPYRMVIPFVNVRELVRRKEFLLVRTRQLAFVPIRLDAFGSPSEVDMLEARLRRLE
ncbi:hypothetical protein [Fimbriimonas ginsengisoli]|uniref:YcxB-like protein domain-containing protein n=1 Tax=Fimbriimonas ginsengisoli Gsoil 348 TaxID=661478 RepID=A0A068NXU6_FIMGI|nr:hypothetical protein [Fimbriimonas ginsengisoli]AIE88187.1 hypothetical protein OP10G_4819 [Fimbriimonas ginsengisoli Gsoil 348]